MSDQPTKNLEGLKKKALAHFTKATQELDESLGRFPDDESAKEFRAKITELKTAIETQWPFPIKDPRITQISWDLVHNYEDLFPGATRAVSAACACIGKAEGDADYIDLSDDEL